MYISQFLRFGNAICSFDRDFGPLMKGIGTFVNETGANGSCGNRSDFLKWKAVLKIFVVSEVAFAGRIGRDKKAEKRDFTVPLPLK